MGVGVAPEPEQCQILETETEKELVPAYCINDDNRNSEAWIYIQSIRDV
jgi:hypothetical protein